MKIPLHWRYSALCLISSTWCQLEWVNIDTAGWSQRSAVCSQQKCLCCLIVNIVISRQSAMFSKSAVLLLLCLQAFGLMPGIGGLVMGEEGLAANCTTRLMSAQNGSKAHIGYPCLNLCAFPVFFLERWSCLIIISPLIILNRLLYWGPLVLGNLLWQIRFLVGVDRGDLFHFRCFFLFRKWKLLPSCNQVGHSVCIESESFNLVTIRLATVFV